MFYLLAELLVDLRAELLVDFLIELRQYAAVVLRVELPVGLRVELQVDRAPRTVMFDSCSGCEHRQKSFMGRRPRTPSKVFSGSTSEAHALRTRLLVTFL